MKSFKREWESGYLITVRGPRSDSKIGDPWYIEPDKITKKLDKSKKEAVSSALYTYTHRDI